MQSKDSFSWRRRKKRFLRESVETKVRITIEKGHERYNFWIPIKVILGAYDFPVLLGRAGFFDNFIILFNQKREKVWLKKII